ncbi:benzoate/H(+) symporter BenE family transporter [Rubellimicrobium aerolatum]|uniref:Benzoate/H(+) symporter BenE family transporter n=1 Tax=Rubellimicrobium aerolatum TaxID=490979 RepID=A0ABW0S7P0_9RHOB|nr:benzoate/H(+) symporter BenE family transporter [Rubellimicrobium aerolatum]MBP1804627.1 benzoate membrane transport protein [Rubellimicrobium aerolatum]
MRASLLSAALVAALVGFGSTIALVLAAAAAVGATPAQTASWVLAVALAKALGSAGLSWWSRVPMVLAWSTPGAALVAATQGLSMEQAAGAFVLSGLLIAALGLIRPLGRLVARIPDGIAAGMLAGVLLPFVLRLAPAAASSPLLLGPMLLAFALVRLRNPAWAVLVALALGLALAALTGAAHAPGPAGLPTLVFVTPHFDWGTAVGLALPLALVTMASQNLPGFATVRAAGYEPPVGAALTTTGLLSAGAGLFGAHPVSMAAITAAICLGEDVHPDRTKRWTVGLAYAGFWVILGLASPLAVAALAALPPALVAGIVGIALLGPLAGAITGATANPLTRFPAVVTLAVTASGVAAFGIGAAFWGLVAGLLLHALDALALRRARPSGTP